MAEKKNKYIPTKWTEDNQQSQSSTQQTTQTNKTLDHDLVNQIMSGLLGQMTDEEIRAYAESLLAPTLNAELEAAQQAHDASVLGYEGEIENFAASLTRSIEEQQAANAKSKAQIDAAALARGMGRSSYTLQTLANQDLALAETTRKMSEETARQQAQIYRQITQAGQQNAQTQGRLKADYATNLAAKIQQLKNEQQTAHNQNYMTAVSSALGSRSDTSSTTTDTNSSLQITGKITNPSEHKSTGSTSSGVTKPNTVTVGQKT